MDIKILVLITDTNIHFFKDLNVDQRFNQLDYFTLQTDNQLFELNPTKCFKKNKYTLKLFEHF